MKYFTSLYINFDYAHYIFTMTLVTKSFFDVKLWASCFTVGLQVHECCRGEAKLGSCPHFKKKKNEPFTIECCFALTGLKKVHYSKLQVGGWRNPNCYRLQIGNIVTTRLGWTITLNACTCKREVKSNHVILWLFSFFGSTGISFIKCI